ncbi:MAG: VWA domain-containing protein [Endozoicomonadaceae bacterium]|nr:VWA domain-containing protein [Endozoicomonadaceae bacterium]
MDNFYSMGIDYPWMLLLFPLPWLLLRFLPSVKRPALALYAPALFALTKKKFNHNQQANSATLRLHKFSFCLCWGLILLSLAHPWSKYTQTIKSPSADALMIAMDISNSMLTRDARGLNNRNHSRLMAAQKFLSRVISHYSHNQIGLIVFGSAAYLAAPFTYDHKTLVKFISNIKTGLAGTKTAIGDTINFSIDKLLSTNANISANHRKIILLLSDGENNTGATSPENASVRANQQGVSVFTLGVGIGHHHEDAVNARFALQKIAAATDTVFVDIEAPDALPKLTKAIDKIKTTYVVKKETVTQKSSLMVFPLFFAFLISLWWLFIHTRGYL